MDISESQKEKKDPSEISLQAISGVGLKTAETLKRLGLETVDDLLHHFPHRYLDLRRVKKISEVKEGDEVTVRGRIKNIKKIRSRRGTSVLTISLFDKTGYINGLWYNQNYIADRLKIDTEVTFSGKVVWNYHQLQMQNPLFDILSEDADISEAVHTGRVIPFHPVTKGMSVTYMRRLVKKALDEFGEIDDPMPADLLRKYRLPVKSVAIQNVHFPNDRRLWRDSRKRLIFEELFILEIGMLLRKHRLETTSRGISHKLNVRLLDKLLGLLPWELTGDQKKVVEEIKADLAKPYPMHRLLQGDVGSGKTIVALAMMVLTVRDGFQSVLMAPTEILAEQHYLKLHSYIDKLGISATLITGSLKTAEKNKRLQGLANGDYSIIFGTHALIQSGVKFKKLGSIVIDEQHRFGVNQRLKLRDKGREPDILVMTATPIPRSMALTLYGDLDISSIRELPGGRRLGDHVKTILFPKKNLHQAYKIIRDEVNRGRQGFIVCPLIDESDKLQVRSVVQEAEYLRRNVYADLKVEILHGKMSTDEKEKIMHDFRAGLIDIIISTTVIEVGIDVPNTSVILIEHAERFGLSQLHQLRGRVGRGVHKGKCLLFAELKTDEAKRRMQAITKINDGFKLAEIDLKIRGEGQIFGARQSGLPDLKLARLTIHGQVLDQARAEAKAFLAQDPTLSAPVYKNLKKELKKRFFIEGDWLFSG